MDASDVKMRVTNLGHQVRSSLSVEQRESFDVLVEVGEEVLAVEMLADWLSEDEVPTSASFHAEALSLARDLGIQARIAHVLAYGPQNRATE